jgi:hypothetical protein
MADRQRLASNGDSVKPTELVAVLDEMEVVDEAALGERAGRDHAVFLVVVGKEDDDRSFGIVPVDRRGALPTTDAIVDRWAGVAR